MEKQYNYDPETGIFTWAIDKSGRKAGEVAGYTQRNGYIIIREFGKSQSAHRLAWLYMTGEWPQGFIDHIDRNRANNAWANLRIVTRSQNARNSVRPRLKNPGLPRGVIPTVTTGRFQAQACSKEGKTICLGCYDTIEEAHQTYLDYCKEHGLDEWMPQSLFVNDVQ